MRTVDVVPTPLSALAAALDEVSARRLESGAQRARALLGDRVVWTVAATEVGGVGELLRTLLPYVAGAGVDVRWLVVDGDPGFSRVTTRLHHALHGDHARLLAGAVGELRRSIKWQPAIFDLMADTFTLFELQKTVEAILGPHLHKQNFRRLVESAGLVEPTGEVRTRTGGRPAKLFRFRREVLLERPAPGVRVKPGRV